MVRGLKPFQWIGDRLQQWGWWDPLVRAWEGAGSESSAGVRVGTAEAKSLTAWYQGIRLISETLLQVPPHIFRRLPDGKERDSSHRLSRIVEMQANPYQPAGEFREMLNMQALQYGDGYAEIEFSGREVVALWPLESPKMTVLRKNGLESYEYQLPNGQIKKLMYEQVFHLRGVSQDGLVAINPVATMKDALGTAIAERNTVAEVYKNGIMPSGAFMTDRKISDEDERKNLRAHIESAHGVGKRWRPLILDRMQKWVKMGGSLLDAQAIEMLRFSVEEVARMLNIQPPLLQDLSRATFDNITALFKSFKWVTMEPWFGRWEGRFLHHLLTPAEQTTHFIEFERAAYLRGTLEERVEALAKSAGGPWMTPNEVRRIENQNPIEGGDILYVPANTFPFPTDGSMTIQEFLRAIRGNGGGAAVTARALARFGGGWGFRWTSWRE